MKKFFYIHIPKTGGQSIKSILYPRYCKSWQPPHCDNNITKNDSLWLGHHKPKMSMDKLQDGHVDDALLVAFIRDPRARLVSRYNYVDPKLKRSSDFRRKFTFEQFVLAVTDGPIPPVGMYSVVGLSMCNPQVQWFENIELDFMGKTENLVEDWARFCEFINIPHETLPHICRGRAFDTWKSYYKDDSLLKRVNDFYRDDLVLGDYSDEL